MKRLITAILIILLVLAVGCKEGKNKIIVKEKTKEVSQVEVINKENDNEDNLNEELEANPVEGVKLETLKAKSLEGNEINEDIFKESKLTVLNLWGTFCSPCIEEMPVFEKVSNEFKDKGVKIIGVVTDKEQDLAKEILDKGEINYLNIIPDDELSEKIVKKFDYVPVTLFVDENGVIKKAFIQGSTDEDYLKSMINTMLNDK